MSTMGKCQECKLIYSWRGKPLLRTAHCIHCRKPLRRTTTELGVSPSTRHNWTRTVSKPYHTLTPTIYPEPKKVSTNATEQLNADLKRARVELDYLASQAKASYAGTASDVEKSTNIVRKVINRLSAIITGYANE